MATYVQGAQEYMPEFKPFTPDYKFLSDVLDVRTDRYNSNYQQINDFYGKVVYADLSRNDTQETRDQYAKDLAPKLQQISGMDLSVIQNADAAKALFKPFYEDDLIVRDLVNTQSYKRERSIAQGFLDSNDREVRSKYWQDGIEAMDYQMQDFKNASAEKAVSMGAPKYVPNVNLYEASMKYLKDNGYSVEQDTLDKSGYWKIRQKNGSLVTGAAYEELKRVMIDDPAVQNAYYTQSYVQSRRHADKGMQSGSYRTVDEGQLDWANKTIADINLKVQANHPKTQEQLAKAEAAKKNWETYQKEDGIIPGSDEEKAMMEALTGHTAAEGKVRYEQNILQNASSPTNDNKAILNKAYNMLMNFNMQDDLLAAAKSYSMKDYKLTMDANEYKVQEIAHQNRMTEQAEAARINHLYKIAEIDYEKGQTPDQLAAVKKIQDAINGVTPGDETTTKIDDKTNILKLNQQARNEQVFKNNNSIADWVKKYHVATESLKGRDGNPSMMTINTAQGKQTVTVDQASKILSKPENSKYLGQLYGENLRELAKASKENPLLIKANKGALYNDLVTSKDQIQSSIAKVERGAQLEAQNYYENLQRLKQTKYGSELNLMLKSGAPLLVDKPSNRRKEAEQLYGEKSTAKIDNDIPKMMTQKQFQDEFIKRYNKGVLKNKDGQKLDLGSRYTAYDGTVSYGADIPRTRQVYEPASDAVLRKKADEAYASQRVLINKTQNGTLNRQATREGLKGDSAAFKPFSLNAWNRGVDPADMNEGNLITYPTYSETVDPLTMLKNPGATEMFLNFANQYKLTTKDALSVVSLVDVETGLATATKDPKAQSLIGQAMLDISRIIADPKKAEKGNTPYFKITYAPQYGAAKDKTKDHGAYVITFDAKYLKSMTGGLSTGEDGTLTSKNGLLTDGDVTKYEKIVVGFNKNKDMNPRAAGNYNFSATESKAEMNPNKSYRYEAPDGGWFDVYKVDNQWMYRGEFMKVDANTGNFTVHDRIDNQPFVDNTTGKYADASNLDALVETFKYYYNNKSNQNLDSRSLIKKKKGLK